MRSYFLGRGVQREGSVSLGGQRHLQPRSDSRPDLSHADDAQIARPSHVRPTHDERGVEVRARRRKAVAAFVRRLGQQRVMAAARVEAIAKIDAKRGARFGAELTQIILGPDREDAVCRFGGHPLQQPSDSVPETRVIAILQNHEARSPRSVEIRVPPRNLSGSIDFDQTLALEHVVRVQHGFERQESVVRQDDEVGTLRQSSFVDGVEHLLHVGVGTLDRRQRLRRARTVRVLRIVGGENVQQHQVRSIGAHDPRRDTGTIVVGERPGQRLHLPFVAVEQITRIGNGTDEIQPLRMSRHTAELRHQVVDVGADGHGPAHGRGAQAARPGDGRKRWHLNIAGVPIPTRVRNLFGVENPVVVDPVHRRQHTADHRRVRGIGDSRRHADDALGVRPFARQPAKRRHLRRPVSGVC